MAQGKAMLDIIDLTSLDQADPSIDAQWVEESGRRFVAYKAGHMGTIDAEEVFKELGHS